MSGLDRVLRMRAFEFLAEQTSIHLRRLVLSPARVIAKLDIQLLIPGHD